MFSLFGLTFHWYGLIIGLAILVSLSLIQLQAKFQKISSSVVETAALWAIGGGVVGARLYHVVTDFHLYQENLISAVFVWQGGLSIIGAVIGGKFGLWIGRKLGQVQLPLATLLDLSVFGVPVGQALGRLGNFINQELYGWPTDLPWGIYISPRNRLPGYEGENRFHPLFAYESLALLIFTGVVWWYNRRPNRRWKIGSSVFFIWYIMYYCVVRFWLDFLRLDKVSIEGLGLGINQVVLLIIFVIALGWWVKLSKNVKKS